MAEIIKNTKNMTTNNCNCDCCVDNDQNENPSVDEVVKQEFVDYDNLTLYTKEFKEWIMKLFRKAHARMGHIEEDLASVKKMNQVNYVLEKSDTIDGGTQYVLIEKNSGTAHGNIMFDANGQQVLTWHEEINVF